MVNEKIKVKYIVTESNTGKESFDDFMNSKIKEKIKRLNIEFNGRQKVCKCKTDEFIVYVKTVKSELKVSNNELSNCDCFREHLGKALVRTKDI